MNGEQDARGYAFRISAMYGALFSVYGIQLPFMAVWLESRGLTAAGIGLVMALPAVLRLVANPLLAMAADRQNAHARMIVVLSACGLVAALALWLGGHWIAIAACVALLLVTLPVWIWGFG
ncbi:MAG: MFS transporter [Pseudomonadota bacterium]